MVVDLSGDFISGIWNLLYDDDYIPDDRRIKNGFVFILAPPMFVLCSVYSDITANSGSKWNLLFAAVGRHFDACSMRMFDPINET